MLVVIRATRRCCSGSWRERLARVGERKVFYGKFLNVGSCKEPGKEVAVLAYEKCGVRGG